MKKNILFLAICFCILNCCNAYTQADTSFNKILDSLNLDDLFGKLQLKKSYIKIQTSYLTNYVYGGRKDAITYPYLTPSIEYNHKSGLYASASLSYLANNNSRIDVSNIELGYSSDTIGKFSGSVFLNKSFYNSNSKNVQSDVNLTTGLSIVFDAKYVNLTAAASLIIGSGNDFALTLSADHTFYLHDDAKYSLSITPTVATYFGGTGFYQTGKVKKRNNNLPPGTTYTITSPQKFQLLSYEFTVPIYFDKDKWGLFFTPTYAIAVNPVITSYKFTLRNGNPLPGPNATGTIAEQLSNSFFAEFGVYYKF